MIPSLFMGPRTLLIDCNHSATAIFWRSAIHLSFLLSSLFWRIFDLYDCSVDCCDWQGLSPVLMPLTGLAPASPYFGLRAMGRLSFPK